MKTLGAPDAVARAYTEMVKSFGDASYEPAEKRSAETTTPSSLETFVRETLLPRMKS